MKFRSLLLSITVFSVLTACKSEGGDQKEEVSGRVLHEGGHEAGELVDDPSPDPSNDFPAAEELLEKAVEASGGREAISKIETFHLTGEISAPKLGLNGTVETWWKNGDFYMVQNAPGVGVSRSGKQGDSMWMEETINGLRELSGLEGEQHLWASSLMLAASWKDHFKKAKTIGKREVEGSTLYDVQLTSASGAQMTLAIDAETNLIVEQAFDVVNPMGKTPVVMKSLDYKEVDGVKIAFRQVTDLKLVELTQTLTKVEFNVPVDESKFAMPGADMEVVKGHDAPAGADDAAAPAAPSE